MILSRNFIKDYTNVGIENKLLAEQMVKIGNEYAKECKLINATNLVIGKVIECKNHPESDHLHICKVDVKSEILNIICGAPNVRENLKVIVALENASLPGGTIKKTTILGYESCGMLCSLAELGIESKYLSKTDIEGIHELDDNAPIGEDPIKYLELDDEIIDFELTSNRSDLLSMLGLSYEVSAITKNKVVLPNIDYKEISADISNSLKLNIKTDNCYTFLAKKISNITIKESPLFIKNRLIACGIRPINNVVDISNYVMLETGQPLHFYDAASLGKEIGVRNAVDNEVLETLDNEKRILTKDDIAIINENDEVIGLAGVMGGYNTEINDNTKDVVIESAIFNPYNIRYTAIRHLRSEASNRFEKGLDVNRTYFAIERACYLLEKYASGEVNKGMLEYNTLNREDKIIEITLDKINKVLGFELTSDEVIDVFNRLDFSAEYKDNVFTVKVPSRRLDINIKEDLIEEVGRIYGVDNIESKLPYFESIPANYNNSDRVIKEKLCSLGLSEVITYSLISEKDVFKFVNDEFGLIKVASPMSEERVLLRHGLVSSLLNVYDYNKSHGNKDLSIYEISNCFSLIDGNYIEEKKLCALLTGDFNTSINNEKVDFYVVKGVVEELLDYIGYKNRYSFVECTSIEEMHPTKTVYININGKNVGFFGEVHPTISNNVYVIEINLDYLYSIKTGKIKYRDYSKYPSINKDLAFIINKDIKSQDIIDTIRKSGGKLLSKVKVFDYYEDTSIGENNKSIAYSLTFESSENTLSESEVNPIIDNIIENVIKKFNAVLRNK